jgi:purine-binding chemotaxis protein CheW
MDDLLIFTLGGLKCAIPLSIVERVVRAVEISPVAGGPDVVLGLVNVRGKLVVVLDIRTMLGLPRAALKTDDHLVLARTARHKVALLVDNVLQVYACDENEIIKPEELYHGLAPLAGVTKLETGVIYLYNLDHFLSAELEAEIYQLQALDIPLPSKWVEGAKA